MNFVKFQNWFQFSWSFNNFLNNGLSTTKRVLHSTLFFTVCWNIKLNDIISVSKTYLAVVILMLDCLLNIKRNPVVSMYRRGRQSASMHQNRWRVQPGDSSRSRFIDPHRTAPHDTTQHFSNARFLSIARFPASRPSHYYDLPFYDIQPLIS